MPNVPKTRLSPNMLESALQYAAQGWAVLPLHSVRDGRCSCSKGAECATPGKHPVLRGGVKGATTKKKKIAKVWADHPNANIGIATGKKSNLVVIDVDPRNGGDVVLKRLSHEIGDLPSTLTTETGGGGEHLFFAYPEGGVKTSHGRLGKGLDVQADGAYVVAPPSRHKSGARYRWNGKGSSADHLKTPALPRAWLARIRPPTSGARPVSAGAPVATSPVAEGGRNDHLTSFAGKLIQAGLPPETLPAALQAENERNCSPPLGADEIAKIAESVGRYQVGDEHGDPAEDVARQVLNSHFMGGETLVRATDGQFWTFAQTHWEPMNRDRLKGVILKVVKALPRRKKMATASLLAQVLTLLEAQTATDEDVLRFKAEPPSIVNCRNGEVWVGADGAPELRPHSPKSFLRHCLDVDYLPDATCPRFDKAVREIFAADPDNLGKFWHQLVGYLIQPERRVPLILMGRGSGSNGKTALTETLVRLLGRSHVAAMSIDDIDKSRFATGYLLDKLLLLDDDVKAGARLPDGQLKRFSEAKTMTGEHKYGRAFVFVARAVPFLLCNNPPSLADLSYGMQRRLLVIPFERTFTKKQIDRDLFPAIWRDEMSGVLNRALAGLKEVVAAGWKFDIPKSVKQATEQLIKEANPLPAFVAERCEKKGSAWLKDLYDTYKAWCDENGITQPQQKSTFKRNLQNTKFEIVHGNQGDKVIGLRLLESFSPP